MPTHFPRLALLFLALGLLPAGIFCTRVRAQTTLRQQLDWQEAQTIEWEGQRRVILSYTLGGDAGAQKSGELPGFLSTVPASSPAPMRVEVVRIESEPFVAPSGFAATPTTEFTFDYSVSRQPEGWLGKVSGPAIVEGPGGLQRLLSIELRLLPDNSPAPRGGRSDFATASVLRDGSTYRFAVSETGMYKLTRGFLTEQLKVPGLDGVDPRDIKIYGQAGGMLPETTNEVPPDDLLEQAIVIEGEGDGKFDGGDYILLYAEGPDERDYDEVGDRFSTTKNIYSRKNYYFLQVGTAGRGRRVAALPQAAGGTAVDSYDALFRFEEDRSNILHELGGNSHGSGQSWFGEIFALSKRDRTFNNLVTFPDLVRDEPLRLRARMALRATVSSRFYLEVNGQSLSSFAGSAVVLGAEEQRSAVSITDLVGTVAVTSERIDVKLSYPAPSDQSQGWLDWIEVRARRRLSFSGQDQFSFRDTRSRNRAAVTFQLTDATEGVRVWRVDGTDVRQATMNGGRFSAPAAGRLFEYVAFRPNTNLLTPEAVGRVEPQNLHATTAADMIIVTHPDFAAQAEKLAQHRRDHNGYTVSLVTTQQIYNEFSSGRDDAASIRNYVRMIYERDQNLRYLLLFGDGSFDHRNIYELGDNFIPVFEHDGAFTQVKSFPADDFFGIMLPTVAGQPLGPDLSIAVGRLPVKSADEANPVVDKLIRYDTDPSTLGDWRTRMVFVGDDEDGGKHTRDVNRVANAVSNRKPDLNFDKLYFDLFPQQSLSAGDRFPDITEGLDRAIFRGALAVTYLGHGGPRGWAQERVLTIPQIRNWTRPASAPDPIQPPVFITATCTFSNYDDASFVSAGEEALLTPRGGVIALMTTTRPVFATRNFELTNNTVQAMLDRPDGNWRSLGDIIRIAKNNTTPADRGSSLSGDTENARKFTLLGDPATVIALPTQGVRTTMIDTFAVDSVRTDTVRALQKMRISGEIVDGAGNPLTNFNGQVFPTIYDKAQTIPTLQQDAGSPLIEVEVQRNIVFRGRATVTDGKFTFEFVVPNDINYAFGAGKISYYAADKSTLTDAAGFYDRLIIGGTGDNSMANDEGPQVDIFLDDTDFVGGGQVDEDPVLLLHLSDDLGINVTGNSIGHDLEAVLDEDTRNAIVLNDYYEADVDDFRSGKVRYPLFDLEPGRHTISVRAWDVANNSTVSVQEFFVAADGAAALSHVLNYPNPFTTSTCFQFDHTLVSQDVDAIVQIFTVNGRLVKTLEKFYEFSDGSIRQNNCISWDGLDDYGDQLARGVYLYQVRLRGDGVNKVDGELEKLVILR